MYFEQYSGLSQVPSSLTIVLFFLLTSEVSGSDPGKGKYDFYISDVLKNLKYWKSEDWDIQRLKYDGYVIQVGMPYSSE